MPHPLTKGTAFFTDAEQEWIRANMDEFLELNGKSRVQVEGHTRTETVASSHYDVLQERFQQRFPYRDPNCTESYEKKYEGLECTEKEWIGMGRRIYVWLQKRKNMELKAQQSPSRTKLNATQNVLREDLKFLGPEYRSDPRKAGELSLIMSELAGDAKFSWAEIKEEELQRRQSNLPADLQATVEMLSRSTGAEIYAAAVWQREGEVKSIDLSSERSQGYIETDEALNSRPSLETAHKHAGRAVIADAARGGMPVLPPPLTDQLDTRLAHDTHLAAAKLDLTWGELPPERSFQFLQPRPGVFATEPPKERSKTSRFYYPPESIAYALRVAQPTVSKTSNREDGLPFFDPHDAYMPVNHEGMQATAAILTNTPLHEPFLFMGEYERAGPFQPQQALDTDWHVRCSGFPHLPTGLPPDDASLEYFCAHRTFVREEFFNFLDRDHARWSLPACLAWANPENWMHEPSGTIEGGPYGCKWPILLLAFLLVSARQLELGNNPEYPRVLSPAFSARDLEQIYGVSQLWADQFEISVGILLSASDRHVASSAFQELLEGQQAELVIRIRPSDELSEWEREQKDSQSYEDFIASQEAAKQSVSAGKKRVAAGSNSRRKRARSGTSDDGKNESDQGSNAEDDRPEKVAAPEDEKTKKGPAPGPSRRGKGRGRAGTRGSQMSRAKRNPKAAASLKTTARTGTKVGKAGPATKASASKQKTSGKATSEPDVDEEEETAESEPDEQDEIESDDDTSPTTVIELRLIGFHESYSEVYSRYMAAESVEAQEKYRRVASKFHPRSHSLASVIQPATLENLGIKPFEYQAHVSKIVSVIVKRLAIATGAHFFVAGCWGKDERTTMCMSYATEGVEKYCSMDNGVATLDNFSIYAERLLGPGFTTLNSKVMAVTYGLPHDQFQPRLPARHVIKEDEAENVVAYMLCKAYWQGSTEPIDWKKVADDMDAGGETYIERKRLPVGCPSLRNCELWTLEETRLLAAHIRSHQARSDAGDLTAEETAFQWKTLRNRQNQEPIVKLSYRRNIHEPILYGYSAGSACYMNRVMREAADPQPAKQLCSDTERMMLEDSNLLNGELPMLLEMVEYTCSKCVFQTSEGIAQDALPIIQWVTSNKASLSMALSHVELPPPFYYLNSRTFWRWSPQEMMRWSCNRPLAEPQGGRIRGSPVELFAHFLALVIMARQVSHPITPRVYAEGIRYEFGNNDKAFIALAAAGLKNNIREAFPQAGSHSSFITCRPSRYKPLRLNQAFKQIVDSQALVVMRRVEWVPTGGMLEFWPAHLSNNHGLQDVEREANHMDLPCRSEVHEDNVAGDLGAGMWGIDQKNVGVEEKPGENVGELGTGTERRVGHSDSDKHFGRSLQTIFGDRSSIATNKKESFEATQAARRSLRQPRDLTARALSTSSGSSGMRMEVVIPVGRTSVRSTLGAGITRTRPEDRPDNGGSDASLRD
ncbi:hypothetical protein BDV93DRAFT_515911 [Ceratobasidium sp. AG-I]|nr:hypothetical protein BDV93DRAFT_515911 [Ceratobasidium sp. AG-I]